MIVSCGPEFDSVRRRVGWSCLILPPVSGPASRRRRAVVYCPAPPQASLRSKLCRIAIVGSAAEDPSSNIPSSCPRAVLTDRIPVQPVRQSPGASIASHPREPKQKRTVRAIPPVISRLSDPNPLSSFSRTDNGMRGGHASAREKGVGEGAKVYSSRI